MPWTAHGHWYGDRKPGKKDERERPAMIARCGGTAACQKCAYDAGQFGGRRGRR